MLDVLAFIAVVVIVGGAAWHLVIVPVRQMWRTHQRRRRGARRPGYIDLRTRH